MISNTIHSNTIQYNTPLNAGMALNNNPMAAFHTSGFKRISKLPSPYQMIETKSIGLAQ